MWSYYGALIIVVDIYDADRPLIMKDWEKFIEEQTEKGFFPKVEKKTIEEILEND